MLIASVTVTARFVVLFSGASVCWAEDPIDPIHIKTANDDQRIDRLACPYICPYLSGTVALLNVISVTLTFCLDHTV
jgi:hypothetical protein